MVHSIICHAEVTHGRRAEGRGKAAENRVEGEFDYFRANQDALVEQYNGRVIVIKDRVVLGAYDSYIEAVVETQKHHELGTFLVQAVSPGKEAYTVTFRGRRLRL